jgi:hypothetical protein
MQLKEEGRDWVEDGKGEEAQGYLVETPAMPIT